MNAVTRVFELTGRRMYPVARVFRTMAPIVARSLLALAFTAAGGGVLGAQGTIAGIALDDDTGAAMPCISVSLVRSDGDVVASTQTLSDGAFMMPSPDAGEYRLRFKMWGAHLLYSPYDTLAPDVNRETIHRLEFRLAADEKGVTRYSDSNPNRPPLPVNRSAAPDYPYVAKQNGRDGEVLMRYLVNDDGTVREDFTHAVEQTHATFERAVRKYVHTTAFTPSYRDNQPVCALVFQQFKFSVSRP